MTARFPILLAALAIQPSANGQVTPGPLAPATVRMASVTASVAIDDGVATTRLRELLRNDTARDAEAIWVLPLPDGAVADRFEMTVGGKRMAGEVLGAAEARTVYETIVRKRRDPGLLEYFGRGCLRARIFPIPAHGEVVVDVGFRHVLEDIGGLHRWTFALGATGIEGSAPEQVALDLLIRSRKPIRNVFSPIAGVHVVKGDDHEARVSFEGRGGDLPQQELAVLYGLSEAEFGLNLMSHRKSGQQDGWFMMLIAPKRDWQEERVLKKSVVFVLDTSGSMAGQKIAQAKAALRFFVQSLRPGDRFDIVPFSTEPQPFFGRPVDVTADNVAIALEKITAIEARGGTNIAGALRQALPAGSGDGEHVAMTVFLTDGKPTVDETDPQVILAEARKTNTGGTRIFVFGVGNDVHTHLLDTLAADSGGTRDYVREGEDIEEKTGALFTKLANPVMTDVAVKIDGIVTKLLVPAKLPDLFQGGRVVLLGRYEGSGHCAIRLSGRVEGVLREYVYEGDLAGDERSLGHDFVPKLWAERRVATLLDAIRLNGPAAELVDEVRLLGREYGVVTPYTSHLIVEDGLALGPRPGGAGGRGGGGAYRGPGDSRPPVATNGGPGTPGPAGPSTPGPSGPATGGRAAASEGEPPSLDDLAARLRDAGVLPKDAAPAELRRLAAEVARELRSAESGLRDLGRRASGEAAVDDSAFLARLLDPTAGSPSDEFFMGGGKARERARLLDRFVRTVRDKVFVLREGVWVDRSYDDAKMRERKRVVEAWSKEYFELIEEHPELRPWLALSARLIVVLEGQAIEIREPAPPDTARDPSRSGTGG